MQYSHCEEREKKIEQSKAQESDRYPVDKHKYVNEWNRCHLVPRMTHNRNDFQRNSQGSLRSTLEAECFGNSHFVAMMLHTRFAVFYQASSSLFLMDTAPVDWSPQFFMYMEDRSVLLGSAHRNFERLMSASEKAVSFEKLIGSLPYRVRESLFCTFLIDSEGPLLPDIEKKRFAFIICKVFFDMMSTSPHPSRAGRGLCKLCIFCTALIAA